MGKEGVSLFFHFPVHLAQAGAAQVHDRDPGPLCGQGLTVTVAAPIPEAPPVTMATLSLNRISFPLLRDLTDPGQFLGHVNFFF
jgi:hypothetical protein